MLRFIKVSGDSLSPAIREGDFVLTSKIPFFLNSLQVGDVIIFDQPVYGTLIKRIEQVLDGGAAFFVVGADEFSVDSRQFGPIRRDMLVGKVIWHIRKPNR